MRFESVFCTNEQPLRAPPGNSCTTPAAKVTKNAQEWHLQTSDHHTIDAEAWDKSLQIGQSGCTVPSKKWIYSALTLHDQYRHTVSLLDKKSEGINPRLLFALMTDERLLDQVHA